MSDEIQQRIDLINDQIKESKLDNIAMLQYLIRLNSILFSIDMKVVLNTSLYSQRQNGKCLIKPLFIVKESAEEYKYEIFDINEQKFKSISSEKLQKFISLGIIKVKGENTNIPGLVLQEKGTQLCNERS